VFETFAKINEEEEAPEEPDASSANAKVPARAPRKAAQTARFASSMSRLARERERERDMKLLSIAFDLEMFFFPVLVNFGVSKKKKDGKNFTDFARARELQKESFKTARIARNARALCRSPRVNFFARIRSPCLFFISYGRERERLLNFSKSFRFLKSFCGEEEREREREKKGCPE
jgi:hypothetical protein